MPNPNEAPDQPLTEGQRNILDKMAQRETNRTVRNRWPDVESAEKLTARLVHDYDGDAVCKRCGFDGAEWWHWKHNTYEGRASSLAMPLCESDPPQREGGGSNEN